jgi:transketolase
MSLKVIYVFTHDSVGVGEDGPTHQPVEHLAALRAIPNLLVLRPADAFETLAAWEKAVSQPGPSCLVLSRQNLPILSPEKYPQLHEGVMKGAYVLSETPNQEVQAIIMASGSEVHLALAAQELLKDRRGLRVVSMPSWELFAQQPLDYQEKVLPAKVTKRLAVEAGRSFGYERFVGLQGKILGIDSFGHSAPAGVIFEKLGFTPENVANLVDSLFE